MDKNSEALLIQRIKATLKHKFKPCRLDVVDDSALHRGHAGLGKHDGEGGEGDDSSELGVTHVRIFIRSAQFKGISRLSMHRAIYAAVHSTGQKLHSLTVDAKPSE